MLRKTSYLLLVATTGACSRATLPAGHYTEAARPGTILLAGQAVDLRADKTFTYQRWSDDLGSERYGAGTYQLTGKKLRLRFEAAPLAVARSQAEPLAPRSDSLVFAFTISGPPSSSAAALAPLPAAVVTGRAMNGRVLAAVASDSAGRAVLTFAHAARPALLQVEHLGLVPWRQACPSVSTMHRVQLPAELGTPYAPGKVKEFWVRAHSGWHLVSGPGQRQRVLIMQAAGR